VPRLVACLLLLSWISLAEWKLLERLQYQDPANVDFVVQNVHGVLAGTPVSKSWQQRFVGPLLVAAVERVSHDPMVALELVSGLLLLAANLLLFSLMERRGTPPVESVLVVVAYGFARLVLAYRLEYPWDGIDVLLFVTFGYWAARGGELAPLWPLLLIGLFNHETVLYFPLWYLLAPLDGKGASARRLVLALATLLALAGLTIVLRDHFFRHQLVLPGQTIEELTPVVSNHIHVRHNLDALLITNWTAGRAWLSAGILSTVILMIGLAWRAPRLRRAAVWTLCVIASVVCFGYTNETRHYLVLLAFWFPYAWPTKKEQS
jgi:hypothetical protein